jgi:cytochrome c oxidase subunit 1
MEGATATPAPPVPAVLHPQAVAFTGEARQIERRAGFLFGVTGITLVAAMGVLGLLMRFTQADDTGLSPAWFYRLMTLHGVGMITGVLLVMMGALWYVLHPVVPLRPGRMYASYTLVVGGAVAVLVATLVGGFGAGWTFLPPLPFFPVGQWPVWSESLFFVGNLLVGAGFFVYCLDVLEQTTTASGGLGRALGWQYLLGREPEAPAPQVIAATVVAIDGLLSMTAGSAIVLGLLGRTYDSGIGLDALVAKNLVYFFGHSIANLVIYLAAGAIYVILPRYAGRPYQTTKVFVAGWTASLVFNATAFSHHLYMDFVQPMWAQVGSLVASYFALLPVAVVTIYSMTMLVWGSRYRWTLASTLFYVGLAGWAIGGVGAVIDSLIPINFRFHNTVWVVAHFHTYLMMTVVLWALAFVAHLLERETDRTSRSAFPADTQCNRPGRSATARSGQASRFCSRWAFSPASCSSPHSPAPPGLDATLPAPFGLRRQAVSRKSTSGLRVGGDHRSAVARSSASPWRSPSPRSSPSSPTSSTPPRPAPATTTSIMRASSCSVCCSGCSSARSPPSRVGWVTTPPWGSRP